MFPLSLAANNRTSKTVKHEPRSGKGKLLSATRSKHTQASALLQERKKWFLSVLVVGRRWKTLGKKNAIANATFPWPCLHFWNYRPTLGDRLSVRRKTGPGLISSRHLHHSLCQEWDCEIGKMSRSFDTWHWQQFVVMEMWMMVQKVRYGGVRYHSYRATSLEGNSWSF